MDLSRPPEFNASVWTGSVERVYRELRVMRTFEHANEIQRVLAKQLLEAYINPPHCGHVTPGGFDKTGSSFRGWLSRRPCCTKAWREAMER